jgi:phenazine biosynthesis protein phzE
MDTSLFDRVLAADPPAFALIHRPDQPGADRIDVLTGDVTAVQRLADVPLPPVPPDGPAGHDVLVMMPFRQLRERGYDCRDDDAPLLVLSVADQARIPVADALSRLPAGPVRLQDGRFDVDDDAYADLVRSVVDEEIAAGAGANFVLKRSFVAHIPDYTARDALAAFRGLMTAENGAYWTFVVHTPQVTLVGASPERHVSVQAGEAVMNPISGTYRYPQGGPALAGVLEFLHDRKEIDELYMVVDEELKMMARVCDGGCRVTGPYLREMARVAHTEYLISGTSTGDPRDVLRETMFAPTVTGSPLQSACSVIARREARPRGYYSGVVALVGHDELRRRTLDSAITIRTAQIDPAGRFDLGVGATVVRHSDPRSEAAETRAKATGLLGALGGKEPSRLAENPRVRAALAHRNASLAEFWLRGPQDGPQDLAGLRALVVDGEDTFTSMLDLHLRSLGLDVVCRRHDEPFDVAGHDLVVLGPGPGDPGDRRHPKIVRLGAAVDELLARQSPFIAICLSHQVLSSRIGLDLVRRDTPNQGVQADVELFGHPERVGFYNSFTARSGTDRLDHPVAGGIEVGRDPVTGDVHALRGPHWASVQFHPESVLTRDGERILARLVRGALAGAPEPVRS